MEIAHPILSTQINLAGSIAETTVR